MEIVKLRFEGRRPLLLHNQRLANPLDPYAKEVKRLSGKRKKSDDDYEALARAEWEGGLYFDERGIYIPAENILASLIEGGKRSKNGKEVERKVEIEDDALLGYEGQPKRFDPDKLDGVYTKCRDSRMVRVGQTRVLRTRPMFVKWWVEVEVLTELDKAVLLEIARDAGRYAGLGDFRKRFGRYAVEEIN